jgi:hypothetical protein
MPSCPRSWLRLGPRRSHARYAMVPHGACGQGTRQGAAQEVQLQEARAPRATVSSAVMLEQGWRAEPLYVCALAGAVDLFLWTRPASTEHRVVAQQRVRAHVRLLREAFEVLHALLGTGVRRRTIPQHLA